MDEEIDMKCLRRGSWTIVRSAHSAAGYAIRFAANREDARKHATTLRDEERRAIARENVNVKFGPEK